MQPKPKQRGQYWHTTIQLEDETTRCPFAVHIFFFADKSYNSDLPTWLKPFCVVRVLQAKVEQNISKTGLDGRVWGSAKYPFPVTLISEGGDVFGEAKRLPILRNDWFCIRELRKWIEPRILAAQPKPLEIPYKEISPNQILISNIKISQQCDLVCQVVTSHQLANGQLELIVCDGTWNKWLPDLCATIVFAHPTRSIKRLKNCRYILLKCVDAAVQPFNNPRLTLSAGHETKAVCIANGHDAAKFIRRQKWKINCEKYGLAVDKCVPRFNVPDSEVEISPLIGFEEPPPNRNYCIPLRTTPKKSTSLRSTNSVREQCPPVTCNLVPINCQEQFPEKYVAPMSHQTVEPKGYVAKKMWISAITVPKDYSTHPKNIIRSYCLQCFMVLPYSVLDTLPHACSCCEKENQKGQLSYMFLMQFELVDTRGRARRAWFPTLEGNEEFGCSAAEYFSQTDKQKLVLNQLDLLIYQEKCNDNRGLRSFHLMRYKKNLIVRTSKCRLQHEVDT